MILALFILEWRYKTFSNKKLANPSLAAIISVVTLRKA
jgi:hypothetical protein